MILYPARLSVRNDNSYELEVTDDAGFHQLLICTIIEGYVNAVSFDPDPFMRSSTDVQSIVVAIIAFHHACIAQRVLPTTEIT